MVRLKKLPVSLAQTALCAQCAIFQVTAGQRDASITSHLALRKIPEGGSRHWLDKAQPVRHKGWFAQSIGLTPK
jgi:hypothetical protein